MRVTNPCAFFALKSEEKGEKRRVISQKTILCNIGIINQKIILWNVSE